MESGRVAVVEDDPVLLEQLGWALKGKFDVLSARDAEQGLALADLDPDVFLVDLRLPPSGEPEEGLRLVASLRKKCADVTVIVMTAETERRHALKALEAGAFDFFRKPFDTGGAPRRPLAGSREAAPAAREPAPPGRGPRRSARSAGSWGRARRCAQLFAAIGRVAPSDATVLVSGESGTGKELVAEAIHAGSARRDAPFVAVNSSALPEGLAESELFGHERGAFTGAVASRPGKFELAHKGTLFLDEVATLSPAVQAKLLRALESREIERVGGRKPIPVDIRLVAATNEDLAARVRAGTFREDLFYRLNTVPLRIPPLRERREDIPLLVGLFADRAAARAGRPPKVFPPETLQALAAHPFRGNVRELEHLVEMMTLMVDGETIGPEHLPGTLGRAEVAPEPAGRRADDDLPLSEAVARFERERLVRAIARAGGVKARAAESLGLDPNQMKYLCRKYRL